LAQRPELPRLLSRGFKGQRKKFRALALPTKEAALYFRKNDFAIFIDAMPD
jgi:hypothetical protein